MPFAKRSRQFLYEVPGTIIQLNAFLSENTHNDGFGGDIPEWVPIPLLSSLPSIDISTPAMNIAITMSIYSASIILPPPEPLFHLRAHHHYPGSVPLQVFSVLRQGPSLPDPQDRDPPNHRRYQLSLEQKE